MYRALIDFIVAQVIRQEFMSGYRTYFAGAGSIAAGLGTAFYVLSTGDYDKEKVGAAIVAIIAGYKMIGDAGKKDKMIEAAQVRNEIAVEAVNVDAAKEGK